MRTLAGASRGFFWAMRVSPLEDAGHQSASRLDRLDCQNGLDHLGLVLHDACGQPLHDIAQLLDHAAEPLLDPLRLIDDVRSAPGKLLDQPVGQNAQGGEVLPATIVKLLTEMFALEGGNLDDLVLELLAAGDVA